MLLSLSMFWSLLKIQITPTIVNSKICYFSLINYNLADITSANYQTACIQPCMASPDIAIYSNYWFKIIILFYKIKNYMVRNTK